MLPMAYNPWMRKANTKMSQCQNMGPLIEIRCQPFKMKMRIKMKLQILSSQWIITNLSSLTSWKILKKTLHLKIQKAVVTITKNQEESLWLRHL